ncbi:MAG: YncE family protein, partial [Streptosporangiaceae bacterium]
PPVAPDEDPASVRSRPPPAAPSEPPTEYEWLPPLRSSGAEPSREGASPPRQPPPYQPPRESASPRPPGRAALGRDDHGGVPPGPERSGGTRNRRWRRRGAVVIGCAAVAGIAVGVVLGLDGGTKSPPASSASSPGGAVKNPAALPALLAPGCSTAVAGATALSGVRSADVSVGSQPFGVATTADGHFSFVTLANAVAVLSHGSSLAPTLDHVLSAPGATGSEQLTSDGRYLLVAANSGALVFSVADAEQGGSALVGTLASPFGSGAVEVAVAPDDRFAFVTLENSADLAVFNLQNALANGFGTSDVVGKIPLHNAPIGLAISPDHRWLYATSGMRVKTTAPSEGTLTVIDLNRAETAPSSAVVSTATAGCSPVRVIASPDGRYVWVTSRDSNMLLGFSATALRTDPAHALVARVSVGPAPIGLALVNGGSRILVANSNLSGQHGVSTSISVISTSAALSRRPALLGQISTGLLPREFGLAPDGKTVLVANSGSGQVQAIDLSTLPLPGPDRFLTAR